MFTQAIFPTVIPEEYFSKTNIEFIKNKIRYVLRYEFKQDIIISTEDIVRILQRVLEERLQSIPKMNQRVVMYITNDFRNHQLEVEKNLNYEKNYYLSQRLYDPTVGRGPDTQKIKLANRLGKPKVGGTARFYFV